MFSFLRGGSDHVLALLKEGVIVLDGKLKIIQANEAACHLLKVVHRDLIGKDLQSSVLLRQGALLICRARQEGASLSKMLSISEHEKIEMVASIVNSKRAILILRDRKNEQKIVEMGKTFVANASHELRTPITIIKGFAETLQDLPEISLEMLGEITEKIVRNCQRMENVVKGLLTLADLENLPEKQYQRCALYPLVENCIRLIEPRYPEASIHVEIACEEIYVWADPDILELAIFNLIENAAKYSPAPALITIGIDREEGAIRLSIKDRGMGISEADLERIFERFYTVDKARSRKLGGAGIGLSIVKTIIHKLGGTIRVSSELGQGTTFTLRFPVSAM